MLSTKQPQTYCQQPKISDQARCAMQQAAACAPQRQTEHSADSLTILGLAEASDGAHCDHDDPGQAGDEGLHRDGAPEALRACPSQHVVQRGGGLSCMLRCTGMPCLCCSAL